jgi:hypothetical protein
MMSKEPFWESAQKKNTRINLAIVSGQTQPTLQTSIRNTEQTIMFTGRGAIAFFTAMVSCVQVRAAKPMINPEFADGQYVFTVSEEHEFNTENDLVEWDQSLGDWLGSPPAAFNHANVQTGQANQYLALTAKKQVGFWPDANDGEADECSCLDEISTGYVVLRQKFKFT